MASVETSSAEIVERSIRLAVPGKPVELETYSGSRPLLRVGGSRMPIKDQVKNYARKLMEERPEAAAVRELVFLRKPRLLRFADDGIVPNHRLWPLVVYRRAVRFPREFSPPTIIDSLFEANGWTRSWRDTIYDFVHYHSQVHEVLGVAVGSAEVEFGGVRGRRLKLSRGDIAILPAGTGHRLIKASKDFMVVGAYPRTGTYDECTDTRDRHDASKRIAKVRRPDSDPVYGKSGGIVRLWTRR